jgi:hypothetical protein
MPIDPFETLKKFDLGNGKQGSFYSLPELEKAGMAKADVTEEKFWRAGCGSVWVGGPRGRRPRDAQV